MSLHEADLKSRLTRFLGRKQMPRRFEGRDTAQADEISALVAAVMRNAPRGPDRLTLWWPVFEARLGEICGPMWPTEKEIKEAAQSANTEAPRPASARDTGPDMSDAAICGRRMERGEAVGEGWLYGRLAVELIAGSHVDETVMRRYRTAAWSNRKALYGREAADAWEDEAKARHDAARAAWRAKHDQPQPQMLSMPDLSADRDLGSHEDFAA